MTKINEELKEVYAKLEEFISKLPNQDELKRISKSPKQKLLVILDRCDLWAPIKYYCNNSYSCKLPHFDPSKHIQISKIQKSINQHRKSIEHLKQQLKLLKSELYQNRSELQSLFNNPLQDLSENVDSDDSQQQKVDYDKVYIGQLLLQQPLQKQYLVKTIQKYKDQRVKYVKHLYTYDPLHYKNFHRYFDQKPNILLVITLENNYKIAAFTQDPFIPGQKTSGLGLIISLTNYKTFKNKPNSHTVLHKDRFIIFGNAQLQIQQGSTKVYSNLGVSNGYYDNDGQEVEILLGAGKKRQTILKEYQILQIIFD